MASFFRRNWREDLSRPSLSAALPFPERRQPQFTGGNYRSPEPVDTIIREHILPAFGV